MNKTRLVLPLALLFAALGCGGGGSGSSDPTLSVDPATISVQAGAAAVGVTANLVGASGTVTWSLSSGAAGSISPSTGSTVFYTPPSAVSATRSEVLTASAAGKTATVAITVSPKPSAGPSLTVSPHSASAVGGGSPVAFTAVLAGGAAGPVTWALNPPGLGSLSATTGASVTWTPPSSVLQAASAVVTATAGSLSDSATVTVIPSGPVSLPNWTYKAPSDWTSGSLALSVPAGQSAMVILLNTGANAADNAPATVTVANTAAIASTLAPAASALSLAGADLGPATSTGEAALRDGEAALAPAIRAAKRTGGLGAASQALTAPANPGSFCVAQNGTPGAGATFNRISAPLAWQTAHALFYVDAADQAQFQTTDWQNLANAWESQIYPADTQIFGPPSDVDGNGKLIILFTGKVGGLSNGAITAGYYWAGNLFGPDTSPGCNCGTTGAPACTSGNALAFPYRGSNGADMFVMNTPTNLATANFTTTYSMTQVIPSTLAHEFQHLISFNLHCLLPANTCGYEETWLNEALSKVAEDEAGFGWHGSVTSPRQYLALAPSSGFMGYATASMTTWQSDPIGNYEGVHSFLRYLTDRKSTSLLTALSGDPAAGNLLSGKSNLANALGATFESAMADFTTAAAFSNESFSPDARFDYTGADWTPFHTKLRHLEYKSLNPGTPASATLRVDGWNAFGTGVAATGGATITVTSSQAVKPAVLLVTYSGTLPKL
ncbi:hypothetical protein [Anaeromyxobacter paludicola]|uniref:Peptidase M30, hyicolysin n=1 Tax=Anaeromyxobacter paludicola TaxID=2918171 RepID=A0ABN6N4W4_9BACT|nr:hypothetical protein [Anaeromyxobacter paludicola]BDG06997.1 hypothetical protein AMPC_01100 [Anaeromyxobacter paludicola]